MLDSVRPPAMTQRDCLLVLGYRELRDRSVRDVCETFGATWHQMQIALRRSLEPPRRPASARPGVARRIQVVPHDLLVAGARGIDVAPPDPGTVPAPTGTVAWLVARVEGAASLPESPPLPGSGPDTDTSHGLRGRLRRLVARHIADLEAAGGNGPRPRRDPEQIARALALTIRTFAALERLAPPTAETGPDDEPPARSLCELRDELRNNLQRLRVEGRARRGLPPD